MPTTCKCEKVLYQTPAKYNEQCDSQSSAKRENVSDPVRTIYTSPSAL